MKLGELTTQVLSTKTDPLPEHATTRLDALPVRSREDQRKFIAFRQWLINRPTKLSPAAQAIGSLIAHEGIVQYAALEQAFKALKSAFQVGDRWILQWENALASPKPAQGGKEELRLDERQLSAWTILAIYEIENLPGFRETRDELDAALRQARFSDRRLPNNLEDATRCVNASLQFILPNFLHAHCQGSQMLTPLPRSAYLREESKLAPVLEIDEVVEGGRATREIELSEAMHLLKQAEGDKGSNRVPPAQKAADAHLFSSIKQAFGSALSQTNANNSDAMKKRRMNDLLEALSRDAQNCSWWGQAVWHTALHLVNQVDGDGTSYAASSVPRIFYGGAEALYQRLQSVSPGKIHRDSFIQAVREAAEGMPYKGHLYAFANSMVDYLARFDLIDPLYFSGATQLPAPVKANTVFPHEFSRMRSWVASAISGRPDSRVLPALRCALEILEATGIRSNELLRIRLDRISFTPRRIEIALDPLRSDSNLKTDGSRRRIYVPRDERSEGLVQWIARRLLEEGLDSAHLYADAPKAAVISDADVEGDARINRHLFGLPGSPGKFRDLPALLKGLSVMLKCATGDRSISVHTMRHAFVSNQVAAAMQDALLQDDWDSTNPLAEVGTLSGHRGHRSMLQVYTHRYAHLIRLALDADVLAQEGLNPTAMSKWIPTKRNTLQKQLGRGPLRDDGAKVQAHLMSHLNAHAEAVAPGRITSLEDMSGFIEPQNPLHALRDHVVDLTQTLCAIEDFLNISDEVRISLRRGLTPDQSRHLVAALAEAEVMLNASGDPTLPRILRESPRQFEGSKPGFKSEWRKIGFRWRQPKWEKLLRHLEAMRDDETLDGLINFWVKHPTFPHFALPADRRILNSIFSILRGADFRADHVHIAVDFEIPAMYTASKAHGNEESSPNSGGTESRSVNNTARQWLDVVCAAYLGTFNVMPSPVQRRGRGTRPGIYLLLGPRGKNDVDAEQIRSGAGLSTQGLHAMLLALYVYRRITKESA